MNLRRWLIARAVVFQDLFFWRRDWESLFYVILFNLAICLHYFGKSYLVLTILAIVAYYFLTDAPTIDSKFELNYDMSRCLSTWRAFFNFFLQQKIWVVPATVAVGYGLAAFTENSIFVYLIFIIIIDYVSLTCYKYAKHELAYYRYIARDSIQEEYDYFKWFQIHSEVLSVVPVDVQTSYLCNLSYYDLILFHIGINRCLDLFDQAHKIIVEGRIQRECISYIRTIWNQQQQHRQNITALKKQKNPDLAAPELERQLRETFLVAHLRSVVEHVYRDKDSKVMEELQKKLQEEQARQINQPVDDSWMEEAAYYNKPKSIPKRAKVEKAAKEEAPPQQATKINHPQEVEKSAKQRRIEEKKKLKKQIEMENRRKQEIDERKLMRQRELELEAERQRELAEQERLRLIEEEKQRKLRLIELERQMEIERQKEAERQKELEELRKQREIELEIQKQREAELEKQREIEREKEAERQRLLEIQRQEELERQKELARLAELQRLEDERQAELKKQIEMIGAFSSKESTKKKAIRGLMEVGKKSRKHTLSNVPTVPTVPEPQLPDIIEPFDFEKTRRMRQKQQSEMFSNQDQFFTPFENMQPEQSNEWQTTLEQLARPRRRRGGRK